MYELKEANAMVEEFMLLANCTVGPSSPNQNSRLAL